MADLVSRRTKCSDSRKGPQFQPWIWCILIKCLISFPCISSQCLGVNITVALHPKGEIFVKFGKPLELWCVAENYSSSDIQFSVGKKTMPSEIVNSTTRRLYIEEPEKQLSTLYCRNLKNNKICTTRVVVDSPPSDVTDFNCLSKNLETLNCSWTSPSAYSEIEYNITFSIHKHLVTPNLAHHVKFTSTMYYMWDTMSIPRYRQQEDEQSFSLTGCNEFGCNTQNITIDHFSVVKPDRPSEFKVSEYGAHSVMLRWSIPNNIYDFLSCGIEHRIEYQIAKVDNRTYFREVDTSDFPTKNKLYRWTLKNLPYAFMQYEVRIYIKSKKAPKEKPLWSDYAFAVFTTLSEIPNRPPDMTAGAFEQSVYENHRIINVYWKQLEEYEEAGANFTYKILVSQSNRTQIVYPDKNKSMSYIILNATFDAMDITVWSFNINGSSINSSHIYIPPEKDTRSLMVSSFTKLAYENGTYELSWVEIGNVDNYTLFWCQQNATQICTGRIDFAVLEPNKTSHIIDLPREYRYQFAISANRGHKTSGMAWAKCDISKERYAMYRFEAHLKYDAPTKSSVTLHWSLECAFKDGIVTGYNISYCPIVQTSTYCDKSVENKFVVIPNPKQMEVTIEHLLPFRTYQFSIALKTIYGDKKSENSSAVITTLEDTPTCPVNVQISDVRNDSLIISWDPPLHKNGIIGKYVIWNYNQELYVDKVSTYTSSAATNTTRRQITLLNLQQFSNYSLSVQACNIPIGLCSARGQNDNIFLRTSIGPPSRLKAPTVKNNPDMLKWDPPEYPGGTVDYYQIKRVKDDSEPEILNSSDLSLSLTHCEGVVSIETYEVRAVNLDTDLYHGALGDGNVTLTKRALNDSENVYPGPWSEKSTVACRSKDGLTMILIFISVFAMIGMIYASIKLYKKYRKMEDIKPVLPNGLGIPEKDLSKYTFSSWNPTNKDEKPSSDEMLLLPNSKSAVSPPETKQKENNCGASDHTDSTALSSDSSVRAPIDRQASTSDDGSNSSFIEGEQGKNSEDNVDQEEEDSSAIDTESSPENSPYLSDKAFKKNPTSGYVQSIVNPVSGYVQSEVPIKNSPAKVALPPASTSYVMAGLSPAAFTSTTTQPVIKKPQPSSGYVLPEEAHSKSMMNFPKMGPSPTKLLGPENLPTMPCLPPPAKHNTDNSYIQLQSLDSLSSLKSSVHNPVPLKHPASSGYVSPADVVINKHLNNMMTGQHAEQSAILDPAMSPDAYCRFSWSTDPANDNLHTLLAESPTRTTKN